MIGTKIGEIFETRDYQIFKNADWNRSVTVKRAKKIRDSIIKNGYILNPICVNENMEVIDGQGRLEALRTLGMPVHYYIEVGAGKEQCIALNSYNTLWTMYDYICSYASDGNDNYIRFKALYDEFAGKYGMDTVYFAATGTVCVQHSVVKTGTLKVSSAQYKVAAERLKLLENFEDGVSRLKGKTQKAYQAIFFAIGCEGVNITKLQERIEHRGYTASPINDVKQACKEISDIYNFGSRSEKVYLEVDYDKYLNGKYAWYGKKWGDKSEVET